MYSVLVLLTKIKLCEVVGWQLSFLWVEHQAEHQANAGYSQQLLDWAAL